MMQVKPEHFEAVRLDGVCEWLLARKPWSITDYEIDGKMFTKATAISQLTGRTLELGFCAFALESGERDKMIRALNASMAQALATEDHLVHANTHLTPSTNS